MSTPNPALQSINPLPSGWRWAATRGVDFQAINDEHELWTEVHKTAAVAARQAHNIHASKVAAGDSFEPAQGDGAADGAAVVIEGEAAPADAPTAPAAKAVPVEVVARERVAARGADAYDAESGDWLPVSPEMIERERQMREAFALGRMMQAVVVREVFDRKLYLAAGCETREEYAESVLGCGFRTASNLYRTASRLAPFLPSADGLKLLGGEADRKTFSGSGADPAVAEIIQSTAVSNLYELVKLDDDDLDTLLDGSALTLADGRTVSLDDLKRLSAREAKATIAEVKREYRAKLQRDQERAELSSAERDVYRERAERAEATVETLRDGERLWGPRQMHAEGQMKLMEDAERHLKALSLALDQLNPDADVPPAVRRAAGSLLHRLETHAANARDLLAPLTAQL